MTEQLLAVLREGWEGPAHKLSYFLDKGPDAGLHNTLAKLTPEEASRDVGGNSIAAHAHHILFSFEAFGAFIAGDRTKRDWNESWRVSAVDAGAWTQLQSDLGARYEELQRTIETHGAASDAATGGALGAVAHLAYHIGAIRQKMAWSAEALPPHST
ncbi:MAG: DinB family protein [Thermoanaerobaculia bacterium]